MKANNHTVLLLGIVSDEFLFKAKAIANTGKQELLRTVARARFCSLRPAALQD